MIAFLRRINQTANRNACQMFLIGIASIALYNWRMWRRDKALAARLRDEHLPAPALSRTPKVSALVAAWNERDMIDAHIRSFLALSYPDIELVICAGGADDTLERARRYAGKRVIVLEQQPGEGKQRALARCLERASGEIIYLTDADCLFSEEALVRLVTPLAMRQAQVVTGVSEPKPHQHRNPLIEYQWFRDLVWSQQLRETVDGVLGRNCALVRSALDGIGAFSLPVATGTDYVLSRQLVAAGYTIHAIPTSRVPTDYPASARNYLRMWRRWNKNLIVHGVRTGAWKDVKGVMTAFILYSSIMFLPILTPILGLSGAVVASILFVQAGANRLRRAAVGARLAGNTISWRLLAHIPFCVLLDMLAVILAVYDSLHPRMRSRW